MKFTDDLIETTGTIPTIDVLYRRDTHGQVVYVHGFNGLEIERKLGRDSTISYEKSEVGHKPAVFTGGKAQIDDTPENRRRIAIHCQCNDFSVSKETWALIEGDKILEGEEPKEAELDEVIVSDEPVATKIQPVKTPVNSEKVELTPQQKAAITKAKNKAAKAE